MKLRFDTRDTKPKLRALALWTAAMLIALILVAWFGGARRGAAMSLVTALYAFGAILALLWAFREQIRYNPYSYNTIF